MYLNIFRIILLFMSRQEQQLLVNYIEQYNQINTHIHQLATMATNIRRNINNILNNNRDIIRSSNSIIRRTNNDLNALRETLLRPSSRVSYDYENPIDRNLYTGNAHLNRTTRFINDFFNLPLLATFNTQTNNNDATQTSPTQEQINNATRSIRYSDISDPISDICPISYETFQEHDVVCEIRNCGHIFHQNALSEWFRTHSTCPVCRRDIRDTNTNANANVNANVNVNVNVSANANANANVNNVLVDDVDSNSDEDVVNVNASVNTDASVNANANSVGRINNPSIISQDDEHITFEYFVNGERDLNNLSELSNSLLRAFLNNSSNYYTIDPSGNRF